jgi:hypothetical protein
MEFKEFDMDAYATLRENKKLVLYHFIRDYDNSYYHLDTGFPIIKAPMTPKGTIQIGESRELTSSHNVTDKFDKVRVHYQLLPNEMKIDNVYRLNLQANIAVFGESNHVRVYDIGDFGTACHEFEFDAVGLVRLIRNHF